MNDALQVIKGIMYERGELFIGDRSTFVYGLLALSLLLVKDGYDEFNPEGRLLFTSNKPYVRYLSYSTLIMIILLFGVFDGGQFIYFQF